MAKKGLPADLPAETAKPRGRSGTKLIGGHFDRSVSQQLKVIAAERDTTIQELLREALNELFSKYGRPPIA